MPAKILRVATLALLAFGVGAAAAPAGCGNGVEGNGCIVIYRGDDHRQLPAPRNFNTKAATTPDRPAARPVKSHVDRGAVPTAVDQAAADIAAAEKLAAKGAADKAAAEKLVEEIAEADKAAAMAAADRVEAEKYAAKAAADKVAAKVVADK